MFLGQFSYSAIARLKPGTTMEQANADVARMIPISLTRFPPFPGGSVKMFEEARLTPHVLSLKDDLVGDVRKVLWVLMGTIGLVLLIACANVANLLLVRAESRQQELAIRAALGAGSGRIARELLLESVTLGLLGGVVGLGLAFGALRLLVALAPGNLPRIHDITLDVPVLLFTPGLSVVAGLLFGAIPVLKYTGVPPGLMLRGGGRTATAGKDRHRARNTLVIAQVALALVLLVSSGLMIRTFQALRDVHPGFARPGEVQTLRLSIPDSQVKDEAAVARMHQAIIEKIAAVPGVSSVALASTVTMTGQGLARSAVRAGPDLLGIADPADSAVQVRVARLHEDDGGIARRRPRFHVDRRLRDAAGGDGLGEPGARVVGQPVGRHRQARASVRRRYLARRGRRGQRHARRRSEQEGAGGRVLADADDGLLRRVAGRTGISCSAASPT